MFHTSCFVFFGFWGELEGVRSVIFGGLDSVECGTSMFFVHASSQWNTCYKCKVTQESSWWVVHHLHFGHMPLKTPLSDTVCSSVRQLWKLPSSLGFKSSYNLPPSFNLIECHCRKKTPAAGCCARCKGTTSAFLGVNWILTTLPLIKHLQIVRLGHCLSGSLQHAKSLAWFQSHLQFDKSIFEAKYPWSHFQCLPHLRKVIRWI